MTLAKPQQALELLEAHSSFWPAQIKAHPDDLDWLMETRPFELRRSLRRMETEWKGVKWGELGFEDTFRELCRVKRREMLRITVRELAGLAALPDTVLELSATADFCLQRGVDGCMADVGRRFGEPSTEFAVFGMGKLGGEELNYSSDIDLLFAYGEEGKAGRISHHDFFTRVSERLMEGMRMQNEEGSLFRVDMRLRPEGKSGPLVRSLASYENYYAGFGEVWERMALQKARLVAGDQELGYQFIQDLQPFCYPRHLGPEVLDEIYHIKERIEREVLKEGGLERHVKLGRGGIREIEFAVQSLQLLHGAKNPFIQVRGTLKSLQSLKRLDMLSSSEVGALFDAYVFLRRLEHRLQMREDRQTHLVPADEKIQTALARGLGYKSLRTFLDEWKKHIELVRCFFDRVVSAKEGEKREGAGTVSVESGVLDALLEDDEAAWPVEPFRKAGFDEPEKAIRTIQTMARGPEYAHVSQRTRDLFRQLFPLLFGRFPERVRPDYCLQQFERFINGYGSRAAIYEMLLVNPRLLSLLLQLFDQSRFLTDILIGQPNLLDDVAYENLLGEMHGRKCMEQALAESPGEELPEKLRGFCNAELLRIELREILGLAASAEETQGELSLLADVCIGEVLAHRPKTKSSKGSKAGKGLCVAGLGKYGGRELSYGSDLDVIFIGDNPGEAGWVMSAMGKGTGIFKMDARLRPHGEDGPLTAPLAACERYYSKQAQFWERQALTRARVVAGDSAVGKAFLKMTDQLIYAKPLSADELREMAAMRARIENERGDANDPLRNFKTGAGGLVDVEFLAQAQQLRFGHAHGTLRRASTLEVIRQMPAIDGWPDEDCQALIEDYGWLRKLENALRRDANAPAEQLPAEHQQWLLVARRLGLPGVAALEGALQSCRERVRKITRRRFEAM
ncbi:MAG: hypothetical protein PHV34_06200 [Verrucomicrobiae bacterium]|nr:hypothetical protein [Verrucomicrobiae bacterium]